MNRRWLAAGLAAGSLALAGCTAAMLLGAAVGGAIYYTADETAVYPAPPERVGPAARAALANLGNTITSTRGLGGEEIEIEGLSQAGRDLTLRVEREGTSHSKVGVRIGLAGEPEESQRILAEIRRVLGSGS